MALALVALVAFPVAATARSLYVTNFGPNNVSAFSIRADGTLAAVAGSPFGAGISPQGVAVSPDGRRLYVTNRDSNDVSAYSIGADGALAELAGSPFRTGGSRPDFQSLAIQPNQGPAAAFSAAPGPAGAATRFDATASSDRDGSVARYDWDFGDGSRLPDGGPRPSHRYARAGDYRASLTVTDESAALRPASTPGRPLTATGARRRLPRASSRSAPPGKGPRGPLTARPAGRGRR